MPRLYTSIGKRSGDLILATLALLASAPLLLAIAAVVRLDVGRPVLFRQRRPGLNGLPFTLLKFRTMRDARDSSGNPLADAHRLTRIGRFLRSSSLDELPELWNVLKGDMSLVGPRPLLMQYLDRYTSDQARRHKVRPGITGLAQVGGRNALTWQQKFALDVEYVDNCSWRLDVAILALTAREVLRRRNVNQPGHATAQEFMGPPAT
jgi:lipopolysaccharide/colanic/teichoic acid biosynthesis glycosyltransferase